MARKKTVASEYKFSPKQVEQLSATLNAFRQARDAEEVDEVENIVVGISETLAADAGIETDEEKGRIKAVSRSVISRYFELTGSCSLPRNGWNYLQRRSVGEPRTSN